MALKLKRLNSDRRTKHQDCEYNECKNLFKYQYHENLFILHYRYFTFVLLQ